MVVACSVKSGLLLIEADCFSIGRAFAAINGNIEAIDVGVILVSNRGLVC